MEPHSAPQDTSYDPLISSPDAEALMQIETIESEGTTVPFEELDAPVATEAAPAITDDLSSPKAEEATLPESDFTQAAASEPSVAMPSMFGSQDPQEAAATAEATIVPEVASPVAAAAPVAKKEPKKPVSTGLFIVTIIGVIALGVGAGFLIWTYI